MVSGVAYPGPENAILKLLTLGSPRVGAVADAESGTVSTPANPVSTWGPTLSRSTLVAPPEPMATTGMSQSTSACPHAQGVASNDGVPSCP